MLPDSRSNTDDALASGLTRSPTSSVFVQVRRLVLPAKMVALSLKICVRQCNVVKTMQFEPCTPVYDACRIIRERVPEAQAGQGRQISGVNKRCVPTCHRQHG